MKKLIGELFLLFVTASFLLVSCANGTEESSENLPYDAKVYNVSMADALAAGEDFAKQSIKSEFANRSAITLCEEDTWEGYISNDYGRNWNVPSSIYGVSLESISENPLIVNGEDLGTLQNLQHHKDENGNFRKAVFIYKDKVYYVLDKQSENGSYIVLSSEDDFDHIVFDQEGKIDSKNFSNFKIWTWTLGADGNFYRRGNLGYAYTLRNVQMQDGSYATVTVSGFNYYSYGLRVWIKETDGNTEAATLPDQENYKREVLVPPATLKEHLKDSDFDFAYEIVNKTSAPLKVSAYLRDGSCEYEYSFIATTGTGTCYTLGNYDECDFVEIPVNESYRMNLNYEDLLTAYKKEGRDNFVLGCFFYPQKKWRCGGWEMNLSYIKGKIYSVTATDDEVGCMNGDYKINLLNSSRKDLAAYQVNPETEKYDFAYTVINNTSGPLKFANNLRNVSIKNYEEGMLAVAGDLAIEASYESFNYTELMQGERKTFYYSSEKLIEEFGKGNYLGSYFFPKGKWRCGGWDLPVDTYRNKNYTVTVTDDSYYCINAAVEDVEFK